jgi:hypothetical protein
MRFLRLLTNSLLAGALGAAYLTILLLQLNPQVPLLSHTVWRWFATLGAFYGMHLALLFYLTILLRELVSVDLFSPGWISVRVLAWLSAIAAAVAATLMWLNLRGFPAVKGTCAWRALRRVPQRRRRAVVRRPARPRTTRDGAAAGSARRCW